MGQVPATERFAYIDLGLQRQAIGLSRRLTTGQVIVIDIYNPQWTTSPWLVRWRSQEPPPPTDPRLSWREGSLNLLPLPDESVNTVMMCHVAGEFWQEGDRAALLAEAFRILKPQGQLLLAETVRSQTNWLVYGLGGFGLPQRLTGAACCNKLAIAFAAKRMRPDCLSASGHRNQPRPRRSNYRSS